VGGKQPAKMMGPTAGFHRDNARRHLADQRNQRVPPRSAAQNDPTAFIEANHTANILAKVDTEHRNPQNPLLQ
jgi:hypothetical protein